MGITNFTIPMLQLAMQMVEFTFNGSYEYFGGELVAYNMTTDIEAPVYYVLKRSDALFILSRGSVDWNDYATDLEFSEVTNEYGTYHAGFFNASRYVYNNAKKWIQEATTPIYIIGHSYGASVATVLTTIAMHDNPTKDINCIAFAPVPSMSVETNATYGHKMVVLYDNHDIFPTLSVPNVYERVKWAFVVKLPEEQVINVIKAIIAGIEVLADPWSQAIYNALYNSIPKLVELLFEYDAKKDLKIRYCPGTVYHVYFNKEVKKLTDNIMDAQSELNAMSIHFSAFTDHYPSNYWKAVHLIDEI